MFSKSDVDCKGALKNAVKFCKDLTKKGIAVQSMVGSSTVIGTAVSEGNPERGLKKTGETLSALATTSGSMARL